MSLLRKASLRVATALGRSPSETAHLRVPTSTRAQFWGFVALYLVVCVPFTAFLVTKSADWFRFAPEVPVPGDIWHIMPAPKGAEGCGISTKKQPECPANTGNPALWTAAWLHERQDP